ncbi:hypothetical protein M0R19_03900 [Candidatus Pacearchaeota archaeon]|jgi:hypothetical protein|nr:hypothetical protein [Candidatus Pacearchaeota archaeon]
MGSSSNCFKIKRIVNLLEKEVRSETDFKKLYESLLKESYFDRTKIKIAYFNINNKIVFTKNVKKFLIESKAKTIFRKDFSLTKEIETYLDFAFNSILELRTYGKYKYFDDSIYKMCEKKDYNLTPVIIDNFASFHDCAKNFFESYQRNKFKFKANDLIITKKKSNYYKKSFFYHYDKDIYNKYFVILKPLNFGYIMGVNSINFFNDRKLYLCGNLSSSKNIIIIESDIKRVKKHKKSYL